MVIMAEPDPITADGLFGIFLGHTFIVTDDGQGVVDNSPLAGSLAAQRGRGGLPRFEKHNLNAPDKGIYQFPQRSAAFVPSVPPQCGATNLPPDRLDKAPRTPLKRTSRR